MAQKIHVTLEDDIDGTDAAETIRFGIDGTSYEIDLSDKNAKKLRSMFEPFTAKARRSGGRRSTSTSSGKTKTDAADVGAVREWARSNGYTVSDRGRISSEIRDAYSAR